jgi:hypothetical protein
VQRGLNRPEGHLGLRATHGKTGRRRTRAAVGLDSAESGSKMTRRRG